MKRYILVYILLITGNGYTQDFDSLRIYVNPGHGGNDSDDRYIPQTGYWESEGNLTKGLYLRDLLQSLNAVVFISRTQNRTEDDLPLSQIAADANANDVDFFHSIHSNGLNGNSNINYPLMLFRGYDDAPVFPEAKEMGEIMWNWLNTPNNQWTSWQYGFVNNRGDWDFYPWGTSGLGVLRPLAMPGVLSEGTFHDYIPNSWRLISIDYRKHESILFLRSFIEYFELTPLTHGVLAGIVRDESETVSYPYNYHSGLPNDNLKTVDNARVTLLPINRVYNVDFNNNGFFMFDSMPPGNYDVVFEGGIYASDTLFNVAVTANQTRFTSAFLSKDAAQSPQVFATFPPADKPAVNTYSDIQITFSREMQPDSTAEAIQISPSINSTYYWEKENQILTILNVDTFQVGTLYQVSISTKAQSAGGIHFEEPYQFTFTTAVQHVPPQVVEYFPTAQIDSIKIQASLSVDFDVPMDEPATESAFQLNPAVNGTITWNEERTGFTFTPDSTFARKTYYTVTIGATAKNARGVPLAADVTFSFWTRGRNEVQLVQSFPRPGESDINPDLKFHLKFDQLLLPESVINQIEIHETNGGVLPVRTLVVFENRVTCLPRRTLAYNSEYTLVVLPGVSDIVDLPLEDTVKIVFYTETETFGGGIVIEEFEQIGDWQDPIESTETTGTDTNLTYFELTSSFRVSGTYGGKLNYAFTEINDGVCRLENSSGFEITNNPESIFGMWVYGDFSGNFLEFVFSHGGSENQIVFVDTLDWGGWKLKKFPVSRIGAIGTISFDAIIIRQDSIADQSGFIVMDDVQYDITSAVEDNTIAEIPNAFVLRQNYPNPFNPVTNIQYQLPVRNHILIRVYNVLGQLVETLQDGIKDAGVYVINWDAGDLPSGIYFYRLEAGSTIRTRKLVLLK